MLRINSTTTTMRNSTVISVSNDDEDEEASSQAVLQVGDASEEKNRLGITGLGKLPVVRTSSNRSGTIMIAGPSSRVHKLGHRRVTNDGEITYKKFETTQLMGSIQLGLQQSVGSLASVPQRDLLMQDFMPIETVSFTRDGTLQKTPAHNYSEFRFRTFAPVAFRVFRKMFEIDQELFLVSLCSTPMRELSNPGASGSIFYVTADDNFIIKTVQHREAEFLQKLLPGYYLNLQQNKRTLLPKFFGLYVYSCNAKNVRIVIMNNLIPSGLKMHHRFDLKGSTYKRKASKSERAKASPTYKDLDFMEMYPEGIFFQPELYDNLMNAIQRDCRVLESFKIMDYSLLIGIHNSDLAESEPDPDTMMESSSTTAAAAAEQQQRMERQGSFQQRMIAHSTALESITMEEPVDDPLRRPTSEASGTAGLNNTGIKNIWGGIPAKNHRGENLLVFIGIIDILQEYGMFKKVEHYWKSLIHDGDTVSVHRPGFYAKRFQQFMRENVFKRMPSSQIKPALSFRRSHFRRTLSKDKDSQAFDETNKESVTVIKIGSDDAQVHLPPVLQDRTAKKPNKSPVYDENETGSIITMTSDEKVQIYVPSPQSTPYNTITKSDGGGGGSTTMSITKSDTVKISITSSKKQLTSLPPDKEKKNGHEQQQQNQPLSLSDIHLEDKEDDEEEKEKEEG